MPDLLAIPISVLFQAWFQLVFDTPGLEGLPDRVVWVAFLSNVGTSFPAERLGDCRDGDVLVTADHDRPHVGPSNDAVAASTEAELAELDPPYAICARRPESTPSHATALITAQKAPITNAAFQSP